MKPPKPPPRPESDSPSGRAAEALARAEERLAVARAAQQDQHADLTELEGLLEATLEEGRSILRSTSWRIGDLLVHRIAKRLLGRREAAARWAPQTLQELGSAVHLREPEPSTAQSDERPQEEAGSTDAQTDDLREIFNRTIALEREIHSLANDREKLASEIGRLHGWSRTAVEACGHLLASTRWRVGSLLWQRPTNLLGSWLGTARESPESRVGALRERLLRWETERGTTYSTYTAASARAPLGPPAPRLRLPRRPSRITYPANPDIRRTVSIVVLNRDGGTQLHNLLASLVEWNSYSWLEVLVVDHGSTDDSREVLETFTADLPLRVLPLHDNRSYSASNNLAAREAKGRYLFFLNNDIVFDGDPLPALVDALEDSGLGAIGPVLRYPEHHETSPGEVQHAGIRFRPDAAHGFYRPFNLRRVEADEGVAQSPAITAAALLCRRQEFLELGGFDEEFIYGYEDVDLSFRLRNRGLAVACDLGRRLVHDESLTQRGQPPQELRERRLSNIRALTRRYGYAVKRAYWNDLLAGRCFWSDRPARVGFAVQESGPDATAGDLFTARELAAAFEEASGASTRFLARNDLSRDWYDVRDLDLLIVMLDGYDLGRIHGVSPGLVRVAWMRNWFDRWAAQPWFADYDLHLCSSALAARRIREQTGRPAQLLRIATDADRFRPGPPDADVASDYCFSGSYWGAPREIERCLDPARVDGKFALFGEGWQGHPTLGAHSRGFLPYERLPDAYRSTRIVVDDANHATRPWGSVNSRVFDGLAAGALVVTNGQLGAREVFGDRLPVYDSREELEELLERFLADEEGRRARVEELRSEVLARHTYRHRADELLALLQDFLANRFRIAIKVPAPDAARAREWGDYHMALALRREFESRGHSVRIDLLPEWETPAAVADDVSLVLRGLSRYEPNPLHINLMWNISHPDRVTDEEYEAYDHVFVASASYAQQLGQRLEVTVSELLQCADPRLFRPHSDTEGCEREVLFVGNSRKQRRPIVLDAIEGGLPLTVFGALWEGLIPERFVEAEHLPNDRLSAYYAAAEIVLNDHWPSMRDNGFISNRIFDAGASGSCIVSDRASGLEELFGELVATYDGTASDLKRVVEALRSDPERRQRMGRELSEIVLREHTFADRAGKMLTVARALHERRLEALRSVLGTSPVGSGTEDIVGAS